MTWQAMDKVNAYRIEVRNGISKGAFKGVEDT